MKIPRIIHQTWKDDKIPESFRVLADTWRNNHPNWEYKFWTDEMNREFVKNNFPNF